MSSPLIRPPTHEDYAAWRPLWDGYNEFYGRHGETALPEHITQVTWQRFFDPVEPVFALVAEEQGQLVGPGPAWLAGKNGTLVAEVRSWLIGMRG
jgi:hypothetical protein